MLFPGLYQMTQRREFIRWTCHVNSTQLWWVD